MSTPSEEGQTGNLSIVNNPFFGSGFLSDFMLPVDKKISNVMYCECEMNSGHV